MEKDSEVLFGGGVANGAVGVVSSWWWAGLLFRRRLRGWEWDVPKAVCGIAVADDDDLAVFDDVDMVLGEESDAVVVT
jgi:hypothetical protein